MSSEKLVAKGKPERKRVHKTLGVPTDKLEVRNQQAGLHYVWVNDSGMDLQTYEDAGYSFVDTNGPERVAVGDMTESSGGVGSKISKIVNRDGTKAFLMCIPTDEWERQQAERNREARAPLEAIRDGDAYSFSGSYRPKRG